MKLRPMPKPKAGADSASDEPLQLRRTAKSASGWHLNSGRHLKVAGAVVVLVAVCFVVVLSQPGSGPAPFSVEAWQRFWEHLERFAGSDLPDDVQAAYLQSSFWETTLRHSLETLEMSVLAITIAGVGIIVAVLVFQPTATPKSTDRMPLRRLALGKTLVRFLFVLARSIPEYVWALLVILVFKPGVFAGALALGIHNFGVLGRLTTGTITSNLASGTSSADTSQASHLALASTGASRTQMLLYGVLPTHASELITFYLYRWEVIIRASVIVGIVTNAGLGLSLRLALDLRFFTEVAGILIANFVLVIAVDLIAAGLRRLNKLA